MGVRNGKKLLIYELWLKWGFSEGLMGVTLFDRVYILEINASLHWEVTALVLWIGG